MKTLLGGMIFLASVVALAQAPKGVVQGRVRSSGGAAATGIRVAAMAVVESNGSAKDSVLISIGQTDSEGRYRLENVPPGRYYIVAGPADFPTLYPGVTAAPEATAVAVMPGVTIDGLDFAVIVREGMTVRGRLTTVVGPQFVTVPGLSTVLLNLEGQEYKNTLLNSDGTFEFRRVQPGAYRVVMLGSRYGVDIAVSDTDVSVEIVVPCVVYGRIVMENSGWFLLSGLSVWGKNGDRDVSGAVGNDGRFQMTVTEGSYRLNVPNIPVGYAVKSITYGSTDLLREPLKIDSSTRPDEIRVTVFKTP